MKPALPIIHDYVTVIIPSTGRLENLRHIMPEYLRQKCVAQVILVWDDADADLPAFDSERVTVVRNHRTPGPPGSRNTGLDLCETELFVFGEDDAYPTELAIDEMVRLLPENSLLGPNLFEQEAPNQSVEELRRVMLERGQTSKKWRLGWTTEAAPTEPLVERGTTALIMGRMKDIGQARFDEAFRGPSFHLEDVDFQLGMRARGVRTFMATEACWVHLYRRSSRGTGCRTFPSYQEHLSSILHNNRYFYAKNSRVLEHFGINSWADMFAKVTARAVLRRLIWFAEYRWPAVEYSFDLLREHAPFGHRL